MQATVRSFDPTTYAGTVLLDDGVELPFDASALRSSGVRHLRVGQRVQLAVHGTESDTRIVTLTIYTLPRPGP